MISRLQPTYLRRKYIDEHVRTMFDLEDASFVYDLRTHYGEKTKFDTFWACVKDYTEEAGTAVDNRHHSTVVHTAKAISVRDLCEKDAHPSHRSLVMNGCVYSSLFLARHHTRDCNTLVV